MVTASWNGAVIAQSDDTVMIEGNHYFPPESVNQEYLRPSGVSTYYNWKGEAHYFDVVVEGMSNPDAAWYYPYPEREAQRVRNRVAFWHGVDIQD